MTDDISRAEMLQLRLARIGKEKSHACPSPAYHDPADGARLASESRCMECNYRRRGKVDDCGKGRQFGGKCDLFRMEKR